MAEKEAADKYRETKKAALELVARWEAKQAAPPEDEEKPYGMGETDPELEANEEAFSAPPESEPSEVGRTEPATAQPAPQPQAPAAQPAVPGDVHAVEPTEEPTPDEPEEGVDIEAARHKVEETISDEATVDAVMEFLKEEDLDADDVDIEEGHGGWSESSGFATVTLGHHEWVVAPSDDDAEAYAKALVVQQLEDEPELFSKDFIENYIDEERLRDALMPDVEEDIRNNADSYGWEPGKDSEGRELVRYNAEGEEDDEGEYDSDGGPISEETEPSDDWVTEKGRGGAARPDGVPERHLRRGHLQAGHGDRRAQRRPGLRGRDRGGRMAALRGLVRRQQPRAGVGRRVVAPELGG